jgi:hypothetical protein
MSRLSAIDGHAAIQMCQFCEHVAYSAVGLIDALVVPKILEVLCLFIVAIGKDSYEGIKYIPENANRHHLG